MANHTVFDTNVYRELTYDKSHNESTDLMKTIADLERSKNIQALANPYVMLELISHLADENDPAYHNCLSSVLALNEHCRDNSQKSDMLGIIAESESQLCNALFDKIPDEHKESTHKLAHLVNYISKHNTENELEKIRGDFREIKMKTALLKSRFVEDMRNTIKAFDKNAAGWHPFKNDKESRKVTLDILNDEIALQLIARGLTAKSAILTKNMIDSETLTKMTEDVLNHFRMPVVFYNEIMKRIFKTGCDLTKKNRGNWILDIQISFSAGLENSINGNSVILVTGDGDILDAAEKTGCRKFYKTLTEYKSYIS